MTDREILNTIFKGLVLCRWSLLPHTLGHIRLRAMITVFHRDTEHRCEGSVDHRSRPDV